MIKRCEVYKTKKEFKIITQNTTSDGFGMASNPIYILPIDTSKEELYKSVGKALDQSKTNVSFPSEKNLYDKYINELLCSLKEKSMGNLYRNNGCLLEQNENKLVVNVYRLFNPSKPNDGVVFDDNRMKEINLKKSNENDVIEQILEALQSY
jgi:hypothetical protein